MYFAPLVAYLATDNAKGINGEVFRAIGDKVWVVSVLSSTSDKDIVSALIKLIRNGYAAYITRVTVKGKEWMRLRVGFFKSKIDAEKEGKKIMNIMNRPDSWITKAEKQDLPDKREGAASPQELGMM